MARRASIFVIDDENNYLIDDDGNYIINGIVVIKWIASYRPRLAISRVSYISPVAPLPNDI